LFVDNPTVEIQNGPTNPFGSASAWKGQVDGFCCRFPADCGQARSYALWAEAGDSVVADTPSAQVLLPVPGRSRASALLRPAGRNGDSVVLGTPHAQVLLPVPGRSRASALLRPPGRTRRLSCAWYSACTRSCCRFPADRGTSHAPTPSGQNKATQLWLTPRGTGFAAGSRQIAGKRAPTPCGQNQSLQKKLYM
jgi:hypothetical protein